MMRLQKCFLDPTENEIGELQISVVLNTYVRSGKFFKEFIELVEQ